MPYPVKGFTEVERSTRGRTAQNREQLRFDEPGGPAAALCRHVCGSQTGGAEGRGGCVCRGGNKLFFLVFLRLC